jgi:F1F0 ATPase subunit 2
MDIGFGLAAGVLLGLFHFGGLWWTVRRVRGASRPYRFLAASFALRGLVVVAAFVLLAGGGPAQLLAGLLGFVSVRIVLSRRLAPTRASLAAGRGE